MTVRSPPACGLGVKSQGQGFPWPWAALIRACGSLGSRVAAEAQAQPARWGAVHQRILDANKRPLIHDGWFDGCRVPR